MSRNNLQNDLFGSNRFFHKLIYLLYFMSVFFVSFDIFMVFDVGGFSIRASQLLMLAPISIGCMLPFLRGRIIKPLGFYSLFMWTVLILLFIPNTVYLIRSLGYGMWLLFNVVLILATVNLFETAEKFYMLMKVYLFSFLFVSIFGLIQFVFPIFHFPSLLVVQWWKENLPRINGFSYEPSYFATYMLIGWITTAYLVKHDSRILPKKWLMIMFAVEGLALFLSSSRMGWLMMIFWFLQYPAKFVVKFLMAKTNKQLVKIMAFSISVVLIVGYYIIYKLGFAKIMFLFAGLGIFGGPAHSSSTRINSMLDTFRVFFDSPIIGYSLGGVSSALGKLHGVQVISNELAKAYEGMAVFAEVLAASGIIGFMFFMFYILSLLIRPYMLAISVKLHNNEHAKLLLSLVWSFIFLCMILQFNQNILRLYFWLHIAILSTAYTALKNGEKLI